MNYRDPSILQGPEVYRPRVLPMRGKATRPSGDREVIDPHPVHAYQATHPPTGAWEPPLSWKLRAAAYRHRVTLACAVALVLAPALGWFSVWFPTLADDSTARFVMVLLLGLVAGASLGYTAGRMLR